MKRKKQVTVIKTEPEEEIELEEKPDTRPLTLQSFVKFVKCVYSGPVKVNNAPSGEVYSFQPGQTLPVRDERDFNYLLELQRNPGPGCCGGAGTGPRRYFEENL